MWGGSFAVYTDISEKRQALLALAKKEEELLHEIRRLKQNGSSGEPRTPKKG